MRSAKGTALLVATTDIKIMKTELENMNWIVASIRESLEKMRDAQEDSEWDTVAEAEESWE